jgi:hypothetical protein
MDERRKERLVQWVHAIAMTLEESTMDVVWALARTFTLIDRTRTARQQVEVRQFRSAGPLLRLSDAEVPKSSYNS